MMIVEGYEEYPSFRATPFSDLLIFNAQHAFGFFVPGLWYTPEAIEEMGDPHRVIRGTYCEISRRGRFISLSSVPVGWCAGQMEVLGTLLPN
jgi:hypothetical protein